MKEQSFDIPLHDIKPIVDVNEYSYYYFLGIVGLIVILLCGALYLLYVWYKKRGSFNIRAHHAKLLNELDFSDTKKAAYAISSYGYTFKDDSTRHSEMYKNINRRLEKYKYKKEVDSSFDKETLGYIELYRGMLDV